MWTKDAKGNWRDRFDATEWGGPFTEGSSWHWTWSVFHDPEGLSELMGGHEPMVARLDSMFVAPNTYNYGTYGFVIHEIAEMVALNMGQYAHGNEPSHHITHMYNYVNRPWRTQELVDSVLHNQYFNAPDGLSGNEDCGQMSAWYIFSSMGFYPVDPISGEYVLGAPQMDKISIQLTEDRAFVVEAKNLSRKNKYVKSVELNGKPVRGLTIKHEDIMSGGHLVFTMTDEPVKRVLK